MNLTEKIKSLVNRKATEPTLSLDLTPFDFVRTRKEILKALVLSKQTGRLIGIYSRALGEGMFLTGIDAIESHGKEEVIVLNRYDMSGHLLARTRVLLDEIHIVCPFARAFQSPAFNASRTAKNPFGNVATTLA